MPARKPLTVIDDMLTSTLDILKASNTVSEKRLVKDKRLIPVASPVKVMKPVPLDFLDSVEIFQPKLVRKVEGVLQCCGAMSIENFSAVEDLPKELEYVDKCAQTANKGLIIAILNDEQRKKHGQIIEKFGYRPVTTCGNPLHKNISILTLYTKVTPRSIELTNSSDIKQVADEHKRKLSERSSPDINQYRGNFF